MVVIKKIRKQTRTERGKMVDGVKQPDKVVLLNYVVSYLDHNGRLRHHTEDELRRNLVNMNDALGEFDIEKAAMEAEE